MLKTLEDISATKKKLTIEIPAEAIERQIQLELAQAQQKAKIPGFRPGKAPMNLIEKKFGKEIESDVVEKMVPQYYMDALKDADLTPVSRPVVENSFQFERNKPIEMTLSVEVRPKIESLNYEGIPVKEVPVEVTEDEITTVLNNVAEERATYESVVEPIQQGDLATFDQIVKDEGTTSHDVVVKIDETGPYPKEFTDAFIGKKEGETFDVTAAFPEDSQTPFAGKAVAFSITIKDVKRRHASPVDDEFAKDLGFENLQALKDKVRENLLTSKNKEADIAKQREIIEKLAQTHDFEIPESLLNAELNGLMQMAKASNKEGKSEEELREEYKQKAEHSVKATILLDLIGDKEGITVTEEDMKKEVMNISQKYLIPPENVVKYYMARDGSLETLRNVAFEKKVLNFLLSKAKIEKGEQA